jgi:hypothetical protein
MNKYIVLLLLIFSFTKSNCQEFSCTKDTVQLIKYSNYEAGVVSVEFTIYPDLNVIHDLLLKELKNNCKSDVILNFQISKLNEIELIDYKSTCEFNQNTLELLKSKLHFLVLKCELKLNSTNLYIPIKFN